jgi:secreted trypsin-like serine protease
LSDKINYTQNIRNIELANSSDHLEGQMCTISGWGETGTEGEAIFIRKANIPILDNKRCDKEWKTFDRSHNLSLTQIFEGQICAGDLPDIGTCHGDSGGPLQCIVSGHKLLVGIVSFGNVNCDELTSDLSQIPSVYTRISYYYDWILSHIQSN